MPRLVVNILIFAALIGAIYFGYHRFLGHAPGGEEGMMGGAMPVSVAEVIERPVRQWQEFSGRLVAVDSAEIRPQVSGTIQQIHFDEGATVEKGQLLFTIDQRPYKAALDAAQARFNLAQTEFDRAKELVVKKVIPQREFDQRKNNYAIARADLVQAKVDFDYTLIRAPFKGRVSRAEITVGNLVNAGSGAPVLTRIVSDSPIYVDFDVDEHTFLEYLGAVGQDLQKLRSIPVHVGLAGHAEPLYEGHVQSFDNQLNPGTGTIRVRAIVANEDGKLVPGLFGRVRMGDAEEKPALLITDRAVGTDQNKKFVLVVGSDNKVAYRPVVLGGLVDGLRIVSEGLAPHERIVVSGLQRARPDSMVVPEVVPMDADPAAPAAAAPPAADAPAAEAP